MSNKRCLNCGSRITCGCQKRTAVDGTSACRKCVTKLNLELTKANNKKRVSKHKLIHK